MSVFAFDPGRMGPTGRSYTSVDSSFIWHTLLRTFERPMPVLTPRRRMLGVRLSEEEYLALERFSSETGARCVSDVARTAIFGILRKPVREGSLSFAVEHARQVRDLEQRVSQLTAEIASLKAVRNRKTSTE